MKIKILVALAIWLSYASYAQESPKAYTLRQCIDYALNNNTDVKNATLDEYISKYKVQEIIGTGLPQVTGNAMVQHSNPLRRMFLINGAFVSIPGYNPGDVVAAPNLFQLKNTADASLSISQMIFSNTFFLGLKASKTYTQLASQNKERTKVQIIENVSKAYYLAVINQQRINLFDANIARLDSTLKQTTAMNKAGFAEQIDVSRLEVNYNNLVTEKIKFENTMLLSSIMLKYQMNMPLTDAIVITEDFDKITLDSTAVAAKPDFNNRIEYRLLKTQHKLDELDYKQYKQGWLPYLGASANLGYFNQSAEFDYLTKGHTFYPYATYTLSMSVPIFQGFSRIKRTQQAKLSMQKTENNITRFESTVTMQAKAAEITYRNSLRALDAQKRNMDLAKEVARVTQVKFVSGTGGNLEVVTAEAALRESQINYYNALYEALDAKIDFDKALGNLN